MLVCTYACVHACVMVCVYVCMCVCMCVCMHVCMYVCMYVCIELPAGRPNHRSSEGEGSLHMRSLQTKSVGRTLDSRGSGNTSGDALVVRFSRSVRGSTFWAVFWAVLANRASCLPCCSRSETQRFLPRSSLHCGYSATAAAGLGPSGFYCVVSVSGRCKVLVRSSR